VIYIFNIVKKLLFARQIKFERGEIILLGQRVAISPSQLFNNIVKEFENNDEIMRKIYHACKTVNMEGYARVVSKKYKLSGMKLAKWLINSGEVGGWGKIISVRAYIKEKKAVIQICDSLSKDMKSTKPVDHFLRGQLAGGASAAFGIEFDCIERRCIAIGDKFCEFVIKKREDFIKNGLPIKFASQIFDQKEIERYKKNWRLNE
jgi:predicted hydrocarbon binding protein